MSNLVAFKSAGLPAVASLAQSLRSIAPREAPGVAILKMDRTGHWVFGSDQDEAEAGSTWAVNPFAFVHGWIAWGDGEVLGEMMASVSEPLPEHAVDDVDWSNGLVDPRKPLVVGFDWA